MWETPVACRNPQQDPSWVEHASGLLHIPSWPEAKYIIPKISLFFSLASSSPVPHQRMMASQTPQQGEHGSESGQSTGGSSNASLAGTEQQCRQQLVRRNAANAATQIMTQHAHWNIVCNNRRSKDENQHTIRCDYIHIVGNSRQLTIYCMAGICRVLWDKLIAAHDGKPPLLTTGSVRTVCGIDHLDPVPFGIVGDKLCHDGSREWTNQALNSLEEASEAYMVEVIAKSHFVKQ